LESSPSSPTPGQSDVSMSSSPTPLAQRLSVSDLRVTSSELQELLRLSIYPIEHLATSAAPLEEVTGRDLMAMCLLAKQRGPIRDFKRLWSIYPIKPPVHWRAEDDRPLAARFNEISIDTDSLSPVLDSSPPPPFRRGRVRGGDVALSPDTSPYRYYGATFLGREVPLMLVGYCCNTTKKLICCYGGKVDGERVHLTSWRYIPIRFFADPSCQMFHVNNCPKKPAQLLFNTATEFDEPRSLKDPGGKWLTIYFKYVPDDLATDEQGDR
jgi:hypothetical protein